MAALKSGPTVIRWPWGCLRSFRIIAGLLFVAASGCRFDSTGTPGNDAGAPADGAAADAAATDAPVETGWLDGWSHRKSITIPAAQVAGDLGQFPIVVVTTDTDIGDRAKSDGADIVFTAGDGLTVLAREIEVWTPGSAELVAWVAVPVLSSETDTTIYVYYGNSTPPTGPSATDVWTAGYAAVWHLHQSPGSGDPDEIADSSANGHHGTAAAPFVNGDSVAGHIGRAIKFDGGDELISVDSIDLGGAFTISAWVNLINDSDDIRTIVANSGVGNQTDGFRFFINTVGSADEKLWIETGNGSDSDEASTADGTVPPGEWTYVVAVVDRAGGTATLYRNGADVTVDSSIRSDFAVNSPVEIGHMNNGANVFYEGTMDEVSIAAALRPSSWIATAYTNQGDPAGFTQFGAEETAP